MINTKNLVNALATNGSMGGFFQRGPRGNLPYFFITNPAISDRGIRHCKLYLPFLLDYTVRGTREFKTLQEWAIDCGSTIESVRYGFETPDPAYKSVSIYELNSFFFPQKSIIHDQCEKLACALEMLKLNMDSVYVAQGDRMKSAQMLID
jgi:hypothetical protein